MPVCWAEKLGACSTKTSREHLVSESLFTGCDVYVQGFTWCRKPKKVGIGGLVAKILCERHNNELSVVDQAGGDAFGVFREATRLQNVREGLRATPWRVKRSHVDGRGLERWFLKTLINVAFQDTGYIGNDSIERGKPSRALVETAFGLRDFEGRAGLHTVVHVGQTVDSFDVVKCCPLIFGDYVIGGMFVFRGYRFLLWLGTEGPPPSIGRVGFGGENWGASELMFRLKAIRVRVGRSLSHVVEFDWP